MLGGDVDLAFTHRRASREQLEWLQAQTAGISTVIELRTMARPISGSGRQRLVELKAVDKGYPLYGGLKLRDGVNLARIHARRGVWGPGRPARTSISALRPVGCFGSGKLSFGRSR